MIAHTQTIFVNDPRGIPGDCMRTAVASLLDLPTEAVPHFALFDAPGAWFDAFALWLSGRGLQIAPRNRQNVTDTCLAIGMSPRGVEHVVVWGPDGLVHDPHPSQGGIEPRQFWAIIPVPELLPTADEARPGRHRVIDGDTRSLCRCARPHDHHPTEPEPNDDA